MLSCPSSSAMGQMVGRLCQYDQKQQAAEAGASRGQPSAAVSLSAALSAPPAGGQADRQDRQVNTESRQRTNRATTAGRSIVLRKSAAPDSGRGRDDSYGLSSVGEKPAAIRWKGPGVSPPAPVLYDSVPAWRGRKGDRDGKT